MGWTLSWRKVSEFPKHQTNGVSVSTPCLRVLKLPLLLVLYIFKQLCKYFATFNFSVEEVSPRATCSSATSGRSTWSRGTSAARGAGKGSQRTTSWRGTCLQSTAVAVWQRACNGHSNGHNNGHSNTLSSFIFNSFQAWTFCPCQESLLYRTFKCQFLTDMLTI